MRKSKQRMLDGLPIRDAAQNMVFTIRLSDIKGSTKKSNGDCAAARALCRQSSIKEARVYLSRTLVRRNSHWDRYVTPDALRTEIVTYDRAGMFDPGDYILKAPKKSQALGYKRGQPRSKRTKTGKAPRPFHVLSGVRPSAIKRY